MSLDATSYFLTISPPGLVRSYRTNISSGAAQMFPARTRWLLRPLDVYSPLYPKIASIAKYQLAGGKGGSKPDF